jgi:hypothetical protein
MFEGPPPVLDKVWHAYFRSQGRIIGLAVLGSIVAIGTMFFDELLALLIGGVFFSLVILLSGHYTRKIQLCLSWPFPHRWLSGVEARRQGSLQVIVGIVLLVLSFGLLGWNILKQVGV